MHAMTDQSRSRTHPVTSRAIGTGGRQWLGLGHLSMDRAANTLSTGELQRLRLASQVREGLFGVAYVLDEPSAGLHPAEKHMLSKLFERFIEEGNSVLLVEHDMSLVAKSDWIIDVGPKAGNSGGRVIYSGPSYGLADVEESVTARFINAPPLQLNTAASREAIGKLQLEGISSRTITNLDVEFPLGQLTAVSGVSGSGKSTLVTHVLGTVVGDSVSTTVSDEPAGDDAADIDHVKVRSVYGLEHIQRLVHITQRPIGRTPRSVVATYTGLFDRVRRILPAPMQHNSVAGVSAGFRSTWLKGVVPNVPVWDRLKSSSSSCLVHMPRVQCVMGNASSRRFWKSHGMAIRWPIFLSSPSTRQNMCSPTILRFCVHSRHWMPSAWATSRLDSEPPSCRAARRNASNWQPSYSGLPPNTLYLLDEPSSGCIPQTWHCSMLSCIDWWITDTL